MAGIQILVSPASGHIESRWVGSIVILLLIIAGVAISQRQAEDDVMVLADWQLSGFHDLKPVDQTVYNSLYTSAEEIYWLHYYDNAAWPDISLLEEYLIPPFVKDASWERAGKVHWELIDTSSDQGETVYFGHAGTEPGQGGYLLMMAHIHAGAIAVNPSTIWLHENPNVDAPTIYKKDALIRNGWQQVLPYSGAMERKRLMGEEL